MDSRGGRRPRFTLVVILAGFVAACGSPSTPTAAPDVRGSFGGTPVSWRWSESANDSGDAHGTGACGGTLEITSQSGRAFAGRYTIDCTGNGQSSGTLTDGTIGSGGQLSFRLTAEQGWAPGILPIWDNGRCPLAPGADRYEGTLTGTSIAARRVQVLNCPEGTIQVTAAFQGDRR
jgi:hypothetical protein